MRVADFKDYNVVSYNTTVVDGISRDYFEGVYVGESGYYYYKRINRPTEKYVLVKRDNKPVYIRHTVDENDCGLDLRIYMRHGVRIINKKLYCKGTVVFEAEVINRVPIILINRLTQEIVDYMYDRNKICIPDWQVLGDDETFLEAFVIHTWMEEPHNVFIGKREQIYHIYETRDNKLDGELICEVEFKDTRHSLPIRPINIVIWGFDNIYEIFALPWTDGLYIPQCRNAKKVRVTKSLGLMKFICGTVIGNGDGDHSLDILWNRYTVLWKIEAKVCKFMILKDLVTVYQASYIVGHTQWWAKKAIHDDWNTVEIDGFRYSYVVYNDHLAIEPDMPFADYLTKLLDSDVKTRCQLAYEFRSMVVKMYGDCYLKHSVLRHGSCYRTYMDTYDSIQRYSYEELGCKYMVAIIREYPKMGIVTRKVDVKTNKTELVHAQQFDNRGQLEVDHTIGSDNKLIVQTATENYKNTPITGYKMLVDTELNPCVACLELLEDSKTVTDPENSKYRTNKALVKWIKPIRVVNGEIIFLHEYKHGLCHICQVKQANQIALPCRHKCCFECWIKIQDTSNKCPFCRSVFNSFVLLNPDLNTVEIKDDYSLDFAFPFVYDKAPSGFIYRARQVIEVPNFNPSLDLVCAEGIHFNLEIKQLMYWYTNYYNKGDLTANMPVIKQTENKTELKQETQIEQKEKKSKTLDQQSSDMQTDTQPSQPANDAQNQPNTPATNQPTDTQPSQPATNQLDDDGDVKMGVRQRKKRKSDS